MGYYLKYVWFFVSYKNVRVNFPESCPIYISKISYIGWQK